MRIRLLAVCLLVIASFVSITEGKAYDISKDTVADAMAKAGKSHPRLFVDNDQLAELKQRIGQDSGLAKYNKALLDRADSYLTKGVSERKLTGKRLLGVSREVLGRVMLLSWAYRVTGEEKYKDRCVAEMLAVSEFSDWNPSHFLDVGEMTTALAIGYDWLYNDMDEAMRAKIESAIVEKGLKASLDRNGKSQWWVNTENNWNQVCHGGMVCGALAVMEDEKELSEYIVHRAVNKVQKAMAEYEPDGAYPEGPGYWSYGTTFNVIMLAALDSVLGADFGLGDNDSFLKSADYYLFATGPTGLYWNYADCGSRGGFNPTVYWFARKTGDASVAWWQDKLWDKYINDKPTELVKERTSVLTLLWKTDKRGEPKKLAYVAKGRNPIAIFRSGWDDDAVYLGIKGGTPSSNHGHMDVGSFVLDALGERWAWDLGPENYNKIEQLGMSLWNSSQGSDRWKIFRYNNTSHNTLTVNGKYQNVKGFGEILLFSDKKNVRSAFIDMSDLYSGEIKSVVRNGGIYFDGTKVSIGDTIEVGEEPVTVRWQMATKAEIDLVAENEAVLSQGDKKVKLVGKYIYYREDCKEPIPVLLKIYSAEPKNSWDAENRDIKFIGFDLDLKANEKVNLGATIYLGENPVSGDQLSD